MLSPIPIQPDNVGDRVRIKQIALGLAAYHHITLISPTYEEIERPIKKQLVAEKGEQTGLIHLPISVQAPSSLKKLQALFSSWPYHTYLRYSQKLNKEISKLLHSTDYDLIYCHFLQTLPYLNHRNIPVIFDQHNVDALYWERQVQQYRNPILSWIAKRNLDKTIRFEKSYLPKIASIVSVSEEDKILSQQYASQQVPYFFVATNGVDLETYNFQVKAPNQSELVLGFFGSMDLEYNEAAAIDLVQNILPAVQRKLPDRRCKASIIGRNPSATMKKMAAQSKSPVQLTGTVDKVAPYLHDVDVLVLPLESGAGTKLRIPEAMSAGACIIGSPLAIIGFEEFVESEHLLLARNRTEFVDQICKVALDCEYREEVVTRARVLVEESYSWRHIASAAYRFRLVYGLRSNTYFLIPN